MPSNNNPPGAFDFSAFPALATGRLLLRQMTTADTSAVHAIFGDAEVCRYIISLDMSPCSDMAETKVAIIDWATELYLLRQGICWGIALKEDPATVIGTVGYNFWHTQHHFAEIGYSLRRSLWGRGIVTEAMTSALHFGFTAMALHRIEAYINAENAASARVLEKCGFRREGVWREKYYCNGRYHTEWLYGLLRPEYPFGDSPRG